LNSPAKAEEALRRSPRKRENLVFMVVFVVPL